MPLPETYQGLMEYYGPQVGANPEEIAQLIAPQYDSFVYENDPDSAVPWVAARSIHRAYPVADERYQAVTGISTASRGGIGIRLVDCVEPEAHVVMASEHVKALGGFMTAKLAGEEGGAKGLLVMRRADFAKHGVRVMGEFAAQHAHRVLTMGDHIGPDVLVRPYHSDEMARVLYEAAGYHPAARAFVTGKSVELSDGQPGYGAEGREQATADALIESIRTAFYLEDEETDGKTVAIQGAGSLGGWVARLAHEKLGVNVRYISCQESAYRSVNGSITLGTDLQVDAQGRLGNPSLHVERCDTTDDALFADVDILVLAGGADALTEENIGQVSAKWIFEGSNGGVTDKATIALERHNRQLPAYEQVRFWPGPLVNRGGVEGSRQESRHGRSKENSGPLEHERLLGYTSLNMHLGVASVYRATHGEPWRIPGVVYEDAIRKQMERDASLLN